MIAIILNILNSVLVLCIVIILYLTIGEFIRNRKRRKANGKA